MANRSTYQFEIHFTANVFGAGKITTFAAVLGSVSNGHLRDELRNATDCFLLSKRVNISPEKGLFMEFFWFVNIRFNTMRRNACFSLFSIPFLTFW